MPGSDEVVRNLGTFSEELKEKLILLAQKRAAMMETDAKQNAPWKDQTGNARQGLHGYTAVDDSSVQTGIAHSEGYGVHLELRQGSGRRPILIPTRDAHVEPFLEEARRVVEGR